MAAQESGAPHALPKPDSPQQPPGSASNAATDHEAAPTNSEHSGVQPSRSDAPGGAQPAASVTAAAPVQGRQPRLQRTAEIFRELRARHGAPSPAWLLVAPLVQVWCLSPAVGF